MNILNFWNFFVEWKILCFHFYALVWRKHMFHIREVSRKKSSTQFLCHVRRLRFKRDFYETMKYIFRFKIRSPACGFELHIFFFISSLFSVLASSRIHRRLLMQSQTDFEAEYGPCHWSTFEKKHLSTSIQMDLNGKLILCKAILHIHHKSWCVLCVLSIIECGVLLSWVLRFARQLHLSLMCLKGLSSSYSIGRSTPGINYLAFKRLNLGSSQQS